MGVRKAGWHLLLLLLGLGMAAWKHPPVGSMYLLWGDGGLGSPPRPLLPQPWQWDRLPQHHGRPHTRYVVTCSGSACSVFIIALVSQCKHVALWRLQGRTCELNILVQVVYIECFIVNLFHFSKIQLRSACSVSLPAAIRWFACSFMTIAHNEAEPAR